MGHVSRLTAYYIMKLIKGKTIEEFGSQELRAVLGSQAIVGDIGCGDGKFVYNLAKNNPQKFFIGIEPAANILEEITRKIYKKPARGGLSNIIYLNHSIQEIPNELFGKFSEIFVNLPWGSLLEGIVKVDEKVLGNILKLTKDKNSKITIFLTYANTFEEKYILDRELPKLNLNYLENEFFEKVKNLGGRVESVRILTEDEKKNINTSWAKKILNERDREIFEITIFQL